MRCVLCAAYTPLQAECAKRYVPSMLLRNLPKAGYWIQLARHRYGSRAKQCAEATGAATLADERWLLAVGRLALTRPIVDCSHPARAKDKGSPQTKTGHRYEIRQFSERRRLIANLVQVSAV